MPTETRRGRWSVYALTVAGALGLVASSVVWWQSHTRWQMTAQDELMASMPEQTVFSERDQRDVQIRVWHEALTADPTSALALGQLAALHAQRAREGGGEGDYTLAEGLARRSLQERTQRNGSTAVTLVSVLLAQHRFSDAYQEAKTLWSRESDIPQYRALLGEVAMETGDYATARTAFALAFAQQHQLSTAPRMARWLELNGRTAKARTVLQRARTDALVRSTITSEAKAWFCMRVGDIELRAGHAREAVRAYRDGLRIEPRDPRLHAAMARGAAQNRQWRDAIAWGERAIAAQLDIATLAVIADAYRELGDSVQSTAYTRAIDVTLQSMSGPSHRAGALHLLDNHVRVSQILAAAEKELQTRSDIYGYDLAAWAAYRSGQPERAALHMQQALALHTDDPLLLRHARAIEKALTVGQPNDQRRTLAQRLARAVQRMGV